MGKGERGSKNDIWLWMRQYQIYQWEISFYDFCCWKIVANGIPLHTILCIWKGPNLESMGIKIIEFVCNNLHHSLVGAAEK